MSCTLFTLLLVSLGNFVSSQEATLILPQRIQFGEEKIRLGCSPSTSPPWGVVNYVTLSKNTSTGMLDIVTVFLKDLKNETSWKISGWQSRVTMIKEYVYPVSGSGIAFDIAPSQVTCTDEGTYQCKITGGSTGNSPIEKEKVGTVEFQVNPTSIDPIMPNPSQPELIYNPNEVVQLRCSGTVGRPAQDFRWCYRSDINSNFKGWANSADYDQSAVTSSGCQNRRTSTLRYNVSAINDFTEFSCEVGGSTTICGVGSPLSANITIRKYTVPSTNQQGSEDTASGGVIAGAVIGSFVGIILILVIVYFVAFRKKNEGETYRTKEENGTGSAPIDNTVYSVPNKDRHGDRDRSPKDKSPRHYENRGLDEPHTRGYNSDPRGRSNPGMDRSFDDVRDGNMKSSRGPMMGSNASFGSAV
ncbi:uncharacterized protein LOC127700538 isoform X2 [Mytilus californianus]|uniref:uncharacterized protein LOC127700538 isoform X2 n=1 Tax=Mytilus californianus TaxID=6549 RepID=UPI0022476BFA|nr:uncharacterized protein LOC127700538 isoform X2 [Mytilus californianus]